MSRYRVALLTAIVLCVAPVGYAQPAESPDPPLVNWPAPAFWTPPTARGTRHTSTAAGKRGSVSTQADVSNPLPFIPVTPCRLIDTRHGPIDIPAASNRGIFIDGETRTYQFSLSSTCTGLPTDVGAWSLVFQYTTMRVSSTTASYLTAWPAGSAMPSPESTLLGYGDRWTANSAIIPGGSPFGSVSVYAQHGGDVIIDVNGYYSEAPNSGDTFYLYANSPDYAIYGSNDSTVCKGICGIAGITFSTQQHAFGVGGVLEYTSTDSAGTYGMDGTGISHTGTGHWSAGVRGEGRYGVVGISDTASGYGVVGEHLDSAGNKETMGILGNGYFGAGAYGETFLTSKGTAGVVAEALAATGQTYGVWGASLSSSWDAAGVYGQTSGSSGAGSLVQAGVRGESDVHFGVLGVSQYIGVGGRLYDSSANFLVAGYLGINVGAHNYGVYSVGDFGGTGNKYFIEPHPLRADQTIRYVALEGPEAGTYFRGRGRFVGRSAVIEVPEDFRLVTDPDGLSIQVTPIGELATVAVVSIGLDEIVLKSSRDVEFFFTVNGVRHTQKDLRPILDESAFMPEGPDATIPGYLNAAQKQSLINNGTYNADGTVNMQTAERVGWTKVWHDREEANKASAEKAAAQRAAQQAGQGQPGQRP